MIDSNSNFASLVNVAVGLINSLIPLLMAAALAVFFMGIVRYLYHSTDSHGKGEDKEVLVWGLVALFVLTSIWGILHLLQSAFSGASGPTGAGLF